MLHEAELAIERPYAAGQPWFWKAWNYVCTVDHLEILLFCGNSVHLGLREKLTKCFS
jgi:hypothetical protein